MVTLLPAFYIILLLGVLLLGLVLLAVGIVMLFKVKNKLVGGLTTALGAVLTLLPVLIMMGLVITTSIRG